jgi:hypothetical protein
MSFLTVRVDHVHHVSELDNSLPGLERAVDTPSFQDVQSAFGTSNNQQAAQFAPPAQDLRQRDDADVDERRLFEGAAIIAAGFVARNVDAKENHDRGLSQDTIARLSVQLAQLIHGRIHAGEADGTI